MWSKGGKRERDERNKRDGSEENRGKVEGKKHDIREVGNKEGRMIKRERDLERSRDSS